MAHAVYVCFRTPPALDIENTLERVCDSLTRDRSPGTTTSRVVRTSSAAFAVTDDAPTVTVHEHSLLVGQLFGDWPLWATPGAPFPDGSFALFRHDGHKFEAISDPAASRTLWYVLEDDRLIVSTSQRAITMILGNFELDHRVLPWLLSTGSLGPDTDHAWDTRVQRIGPDSSITLDLDLWELSHTRIPIRFEPSPRSDDDHIRLLSDDLVNTFSSLRWSLDGWRVALSGGYDSRAIVCLLHQVRNHPSNLRSITWGFETPTQEDGTDGSVAASLAHTLGVRHDFIPIRVSVNEPSIIVDRFLRCGEGRTDHIRAYVDGFAMWQHLQEADVHGIVRGDEGFGWNTVSSPSTVRLSTGIGLCSDFANLRTYRRYGFPEQHLPSRLEQSPAETPETWRDRLYHDYRLPTVLAALGDCKATFLEQANPLLSRTLLRRARSFPDHLRTDKLAFRRIVESLSPDIPYAERSTGPSVTEILASRTMTGLMYEELGSQHARSILPQEFVDAVQAQLEPSAQGVRYGSTARRVLGRSVQRIARSWVPSQVKNWGRHHLVPPRVPRRTLAFRLTLISRMTRLLRADSRRH